jgi:6-phosphogluconolactonase (cycloisomerase 2 family)
MKFKKFGKALLLSALSAGVILSVTSCVQDYSVGYLYVTGTVTAQSSGSGIITGFKIDHNTGKLTSINGLPVSSGGANPVRAVLLTGSRFLYVLNRGVNAAGGTDCTASTSNNQPGPCKNANITQFAIGANGILTPQATFYTQGVNPFRMVADSSGSFIYVLDHDSPDPSSTSSAPVASTNNAYCAAALTGAKTCGDITAFSVNSTTGRLTLLQNTQVTTAGGGTPLPYFPVPANPVDFVMSGGTILTMSGAQTTVNTTTGAYIGGSTVFPYTYNQSNGQLTVNQNTAQTLNIQQGTALVTGSSYVFVLDNEAPASSTNGATSQILTYTVGSGGALLSVTNGIISDDANQSNPTWLAVESSKGKWLYVANQGNNATGTGTAESGLAGYVLNSPYQPTEMSGTPIGFGAGAGPQCLVEDPSNQFFYTANFYSSTVTGQAIDQNAGVLHPLSEVSKVPDSYSLTGPATWCLVDGRTS